MLHIKRDLIIVLPWIRQMPVFKGDCNIVKEAPACLRNGLERAANDTNIIEEEERVVLVCSIGCLRSCLLATVVQRV